MSWNNNAGTPLWSGNSKSGTNVGNLYTLPVPETIEQNPELGLEGRNEIPLPTKYKDLSVKNLEAEKINGNENFDASKWSLYPAIHDVNAQLTSPYDLRQYNLKWFNIVECSRLTAKMQGPITPEPGSGTIEAEFYLKSPMGIITVVRSADVQVGSSDDHGGSLVVNGGTTLDGGTVHGTTIGSLPVEGVNTVRIDVLPVGIDMVSPTYITMNAGAAANLSTGGALSLAGGSYVEINTDQTYFKNTTAGNDYTDVYVGNIFPAYGGTQDLRINGGNTGRGVRISDGTTISTNILEANVAKIPQYKLYDSWSSSTLYSVDTLITYNNNVYRAMVVNRAMTPSVPIPNWASGSSYQVNMYVHDPMGDYYRCTSNIASSTTQPSLDMSHWILDPRVRSINDIWNLKSTTLYNCIAFPAITGDTTFMSIAKPTDKDTVCIVKRDATTEAVIATGRIYDDTINPPPIGDPSTWSLYTATEDVKVNGHAITHVSNLQVNTIEENGWVPNINIQSNSDIKMSAGNAMNVITDTVLFTPNIGSYTTLDLQNGAVSNISYINGLNVNDYLVDNWSTKPAIQDVYIDTHNIFGVTGINGTNNIASYQNANWASNTANAPVNFGSQAITGVSTVNTIPIAQLDNTNWSAKSANNPVNINSQAITGVTTINTIPIAQLDNTNWSAKSANNPVNINSQAITGVTTINTIPIAQLDNTNWAGKSANANVDFATKNASNIGILTATTTNTTNLNINGSAYVSGANWYSQLPLADVAFNSKNITGVNGLTATTLTGTTVNATNLNIGGTAYASGANWYSQLPLTDVAFNSKNITGVNGLTATTLTGTTVNATNLNIGGTAYVSGANWYTQLPLANVAFNSKNITGVNDIAITTLNSRQLFGFIEVYKTASQSSITANTPTPITWAGSTTASTGTSVSTATTGTTAGAITLGKVGVWRITAQIPVSNASGTASNVDLWVRRNGVDVVNTSANFNIANGDLVWATIECYLTATATTDTVQIYIGCPVIVSIPASASVATPYARPARTALAHAELIY